MTPAISAQFDYSVAERFGLDANGDGRIDLPNSPAYAQVEVLTVHLNALATTGTTPQSQFAWSITDGRLATPITRSGATPTVNLTQGTHTVSLTVTDPTAGTSTLTRNIVIKDILVVSIGDSYASGEGNPEVRGVFTEQWAVGATPAITDAHRVAHRSTFAAPVRMALELERSNPYTSVTFISLADSGAVTADLLGANGQIAQVKNLIGNRTIDSLLVSIGGNDIGFATIAQKLFFLPPDVLPGGPQGPLQSLTFNAILADFTQALSQLPTRFQNVNNLIRSTLPVSNIYLTEYADQTSGPLRNPLFGRPTTVCNEMLQDFTPEFLEQAVAAIPVVGPFLNVLISSLKINDAEAQFARDQILLPLQQQMMVSATQLGWNYLGGISTAFHGHGYCSGIVFNPLQGAGAIDLNGRYVRTASETMAFQGDKFGVLHPNESGHEAMARVILPQVVQNLGPRVQLNGPAAVTAGSSVTFTSTGSAGRLAPIARVEWDFDFNTAQGFTVDATGSSAVFQAPLANVSSTRRVALRIRDTLGYSNTSSTFLNIFPTPGAVLQGNLLRVNGSNSSTVGDDINLSVSNGSLVVQQLGLPNRSFLLSSFTQILVDGFAGNDNLRATAAVSKPISYLGGDGNDTLIGGNGNDTLEGGNGDDFLDGRGGADLILGSAGNDTIVVDPNDVGEDIIDGGDGFDGLLLFGTNQHDDIRIRRRVDGDGPHAVFTMNGRTFEHRYARGETITVYAGPGHDLVVLDPTAGATWRAHFFGEEGHDLLVGSLQDDRLDGGPGQDTLVGQGGGDELIGNPHTDLLLNTLDAAVLDLLIEEHLQRRIR